MIDTTFSFYQGEDFNQNIFLRDRDGDPIDLTGITIAECYIKKSYAAGISSAIPVDVSILGTTTGEINLFLDSTTTEIISPAIYMYSVRVKLITGFYKIVLSGNVLVNPSTFSL